MTASATRIAPDEENAVPRIPGDSPKSRVTWTTAIGALAARKVFKKKNSSTSRTFSWPIGRGGDALPPTTFGELFQIGTFAESEECFSDLAGRAARLLNAERCHIFLVDEHEQSLYTFLKDSMSGDSAASTKITIPMNHGLTGMVLMTEPDGLNISHVGSMDQDWCHDLSESEKSRDVPLGSAPPYGDLLGTGFVTEAYLGWPLRNSLGNIIGMIEFRNKLPKNSGSSIKRNSQLSFSISDEQMTQIFASQLANSIFHFRQSALLENRDETFSKVYANKFDKNESIAIVSGKSNSVEELYVSDQLKLKRMTRKHCSILPPSFNRRDIRRWDFDVTSKSVEELTNHTIDIFEECGIFSTFSIPKKTFLNFMDDIVRGYKASNPYHNHMHAFDVMHVCYLLISNCRAGSYLESFNILSLLVGALAHDLGHDGLNNALHSQTQSELAITYNNISILENYSAAFLFRILRKQESNIFCRLDKTENVKMRSRLIDLILDTDAKNHYVLITQFKHGLEKNQLSRALLSSMILHVADISNPTRPGPIARKWAFAIQQEFFLQGECEKKHELPVSPFMDRDHENLPRMQAAFIDAVVSPTFNLLAQFLPMIKENCLKNLHINRAFWNHMQLKNIKRVKDILDYQDGEHDENEIDILHDASCNEKDDSVVSPPLPSVVPGIPINATRSQNSSIFRKMSLIPMKSKTEHEGENWKESSRKKGIHRMRTLSSIALSVRENKEVALENLSQFICSSAFQITMLLATIYALFAHDINIAVGSVSTDTIIGYVTVFVLVLFLIELFLSIIAIPKYIQFFFWLDLAACASLFIEVAIFFEFSLTFDYGAGADTGPLALARAGRAAKVGARAGRLIRLISLVKTLKVMKWVVGSSNSHKQPDDVEPEEEVETKMSVVGLKMTESITKKVIIAVMMMLVSFSILLGGDGSPDARQVLLDVMAENPNSTLLREQLFKFTDDIVELRGVGEYFVNQTRIDQLRSIETLIFQAESNFSVSTTYDVSNETKVMAWYNFSMTMIVTVLLAVLSLLLSRDAYCIMIRPIEQMKNTVQQLSENPFLHLDRINKQCESPDDTETDILQLAITKMARLLQIGFGSAGAEIIAKNLSDGGMLFSPMVPGVRVQAIFGFCDIRDFTTATESLQEDVMPFVNKVADIVHKSVVASGGAPNKNIGDAFLLVWKLTTYSNEIRSDLQKNVFDAALLSCYEILNELSQIESFSAFLKKGKSEQGTSCKMEDILKVEMGFGLHSGWAIEGAIGSEIKIEASYLSPHVNIASRLESATKLYRLSVLLSQSFIAGLSGKFQSNCRICDRVTFKGCTDPMYIYHYDTVPFDELGQTPQNYLELLNATSWAVGEELMENDVLLTEINSALNSSMYFTMREIYDMAFREYIDGNWQKCKNLLHLWLKKVPGDVLAQVLTENLMAYNFEAPKDWLKYRALKEK